MEAKLFKDLQTVLHNTTDGVRLSKVMFKYANGKQIGVLAESFPEYYTVNRSNELVCRRAPKTPVDMKKVLAPKGDKGDMGVMIGSYGHEAGAKQAADQFLRPEVFQYQSALFPNPVDYGVEVNVISSLPTEIPTPATPLYPWTVALQLTVKGPEASRKSWISRFEGRIRSQRVT